MHAGPVLVGCDFGSTTAKAVVLSPERELLFCCYALSKGNPIEDAQSLFRQVREAGFTEVGGLALTGYGKDLLKDVLGADVGVVETVAHATAALHFFPDADVICDVGGTDVKIMILRQGTVADFRLNSQCSSGNGAFLQGVAERYNDPARGSTPSRAFEAKAMPALAMGCGVFLQSDIVNQQRKGWSAEEIMAALAAVLPRQRVDLRRPAPEPARGRAQVHPAGRHAPQPGGGEGAGRLHPRQGAGRRDRACIRTPGEAGAIGAALCAADWRAGGARQPLPRLRRHRGAHVHEHDQPRRPSASGARSTARAPSSTCSCPARKGRPWSKVPLAEGWERVISGNSCPEGAGRGRQRDARGEGQAGGGQA